LNTIHKYSDNVNTVEARRRVSKIPFTKKIAIEINGQYLSSDFEVLDKITLINSTTLREKIGQFDSLDESSSCPKKIPTLRSQIDSLTHKSVIETLMPSNRTGQDSAYESQWSSLMGKRVNLTPQCGYLLGQDLDSSRESH